MSDPINALAQHAHNLRFEQLDAATLDAAKMILLDTLAVGLAGRNASYSAALRPLAAQWGQGDVARVLGWQQAQPAATAAFMNAYQIHGQEYDCVHEAAVVHPMAAVMSTALAELDRLSDDKTALPLTGAEFITAICAAVDVAIAVGLSAVAGLRFFRPATAGAFGAAAVASRLRGYDLATTLQTFGHTYSQLCGTMQAHAEGAAVLPMQIGFNARNAVIAADLASAGISAPVNVVDGPFGYLELFEPNGNIAPLLQQLADTRRIAELSYKPYPTGRATHGGLQAILALCKLHQPAADNIQSITLTGPPLIHRLVARPIHEGLSANYARLCMQYTGAIAVLRGHVGLFDFDDNSLKDKAVHDLASRISVIIDDNPDPNALGPQCVEMTIRDGTTHSQVVEKTYGAPDNAMSYDAKLEKVRHCCQFAGLADKDTEQFVEQTLQLDSQSSVSNCLLPSLYELQ